MTRAVIELGNDIGPLMPVMESKIQGCAYSARQPVAAFRYHDWRVVVENRKITIAEAETEDKVKEIIAFIRHIVENADNITGKVKAY